jgi:hypothetical protein
MAFIVVPIVLVTGAAAWVTQRQWHRSSRSASAPNATLQARTDGRTSAVRLLRSDEDLSRALERANATTVRIAADVASRRYARFAVVPARDDMK